MLVCGELRRMFPHTNRKRQPAQYIVSVGKKFTAVEEIPENLKMVSPYLLRKK